MEPPPFSLRGSVSPAACPQKTWPPPPLPLPVVGLGPGHDDDDDDDDEEDDEEEVLACGRISPQLPVPTVLSVGAGGGGVLPDATLDGRGSGVAAAAAAAAAASAAVAAAAAAAVTAPVSAASVRDGGATLALPPPISVAVDPLPSGDEGDDGGSSSVADGGVSTTPPSQSLAAITSGAKMPPPPAGPGSDSDYCRRSGGGVEVAAGAAGRGGVPTGGRRASPPPLPPPPGGVAVTAGGGGGSRAAVRGGTEAAVGGTVATTATPRGVGGGSAGGGGTPADSDGTPAAGDGPFAGGVGGASPGGGGKPSGEAASTASPCVGFFASSLPPPPLPSPWLSRSSLLSTAGGFRGVGFTPSGSSDEAPPPAWQRTSAASSARRDDTSAPPRQATPPTPRYEYTSDVPPSSPSNDSSPCSAREVWKPPSGAAALRLPPRRLPTRMAAIHGEQREGEVAHSAAPGAGRGEPQGDALARPSPPLARVPPSASPPRPLPALELPTQSSWRAAVVPRELPTPQGVSRGRAGKAPGGARIKRTREPPAPYVGPPPMRLADGPAAAVDAVDDGGKVLEVPAPTGRSTPRRSRLVTLSVPRSQHLSEQARTAARLPPAAAVADGPSEHPAVAPTPAVRPRGGRPRVAGRRSSLPVPSAAVFSLAASAHSKPPTADDAPTPPAEALRGRGPAVSLPTDMATYLPFDDAGLRTPTCLGRLEDMNHKDRTALLSLAKDAFHMRYKPVGQSWLVGPWSAAEHQQFIDRILEVGLGEGKTYAWGTFAQGMPTRTGLQCVEYYHNLVSAGWIIDYNYARDEKGRIHWAPEGNPGDEDFVGLEPLRWPPTTTASGDEQPTGEGGKAVAGGVGRAVEGRGEVAVVAPVGTAAVGTTTNVPLAAAEPDGGDGGDGGDLRSTAAAVAAAPGAAAPAVAADGLPCKREPPGRLVDNGALPSSPYKRPKASAAAASSDALPAGCAGKVIATAAGGRGGEAPRRSGRSRRAPVWPGSGSDSDDEHDGGGRRRGRGGGGGVGRMRGGGGRRLRGGGGRRLRGGRGRARGGAPPPASPPPPSPALASLVAAAAAVTAVANVMPPLPKRLPLPAAGSAAAVAAPAPAAAANDAPNEVSAPLAEGAEGDDVEGR